ncbi:MAG: mandelate racemase/muconate lactonizing enzyme family protein [Rhizobiales bacterium]|nr:mandelate racemase/muconate lactonizing enzyme family protein [Hyphomicrobiales bacterium]
MKIQSFETFVVGNPPPSFGGRYFVFVKLVSNDGIVGYGEVYAASFGPKVMQAAIADVMERHILGQDPHDIEKLYRRCYSAGFSQRPDPTMMGVFSAIEMACWDIIGKAADQPVHKLLGGQVHERLRAYTYLYPQKGQDAATFYNDVEQSAACAAAMVEQGFTAVKFDPAGPYTNYDPHQPLQSDIARAVDIVKSVRGAVGQKADILFGTHGQFTPSGALRMAKAIAPYDPLWFEEPTPPDAPEAMAQVARGTHIPIATGERLTTKYEFAQVLRAGAASILQPALGRVGGILEAKKIAAMAETFHAQIAPHHYCGPIAALANIQLATTLPNFLIIEAIQNYGGFHAQLLSTPIKVEDGHIIPSTQPGLGAELNEDVARAHPYDGNLLHLEMQDTAIDASTKNQFGGG